LIISDLSEKNTSLLPPQYHRYCGSFLLDLQSDLLYSLPLKKQGLTTSPKNEAVRKYEILLKQKTLAGKLEEAVAIKNRITRLKGEQTIGKEKPETSDPLPDSLFTMMFFQEKKKIGRSGDWGVTNDQKRGQDE